MAEPEPSQRRHVVLPRLNDQAGGVGELHRVKYRTRLLQVLPARGRTLTYEDAIRSRYRCTAMAQVTLSQKNQIVIPLEIRTGLRLEPGQKIQAFRVGKTIGLVPVKPMRESRGSLKGIDTTVDREPDRL